jgi:hypothetical protein
MIHSRLTAIITLTAVVFAANLLVAQSSTTVSSPDQAVKVELKLTGGLPSWSVNFEEVQVIDNSAFRLFLGAKAGEALKFTSATVSIAEHDSIWKPTWGQFAEVRNHYREAVWNLEADGGKQTVAVTVRVFNDGVAIRFAPKDRQTPFSDRTELNFAGDFTFWAANGPIMAQ